MRSALSFIAIGTIASSLAICVVLYTHGTDFAALAASTTMAFGLLLFLMSRAFKSRERT